MYHAVPRNIHCISFVILAPLHSLREFYLKRCLQPEVCLLLMEINTQMKRIQPGVFGTEKNLVKGCKPKFSEPFEHQVKSGFVVVELLMLNHIRFLRINYCCVKREF